MDTHRHSLHFVFGQNLVRCAKFECNHSEEATSELEKALPEGAKVEFINSEPKVYTVSVGGKHWCTITDYQGGHLYVRDFSGSKEDLEVFQMAIDKAFGIYYPITLDNTSDMSSVAP